MAKNIRRIFAMIMVVAMFVSVLPMQTLAAETKYTTETSPEGLPTNVATTTDKQTDADGNTTVTVTIQKDTEGTLSDGSKLERHETKTETEDETGKTGVKEGSETITTIIPEVGVTVKVPDKVGEEHANSKEFGDSSDPVTTGDQKVGEDDPEYDQTTTTETPGKVTITTTGKEYSQEFTDRDGLEYTNADVTPNDSNDLHYVGEAPEEFLPGYEGETVIPEGVDGYDYTYVGSGNTSILTPAVVGTRPLTDEEKLAQFGTHWQSGAYIHSKYYTSLFLKYIDPEYRDTIAKNEDGSYVTDEEGFLLDVNGNRVFKGERTEKGPEGETIYLRRFDNYGAANKVEGWYEDGEWVKALNGKDSYYAGWAGPQQFLLVDSNGNIITTYCADQTNPTENGYGYNIENLEDATYYSEEEAARIRSIAKNGYWGISSEAGEAEPAEGSLEYMKQQLKAAGFTDEELASLTDGVALTATQMAIWSCSNKMSGIEFVNAHYDLAGPDGDGWGPNVTGAANNNGKVPTEKEDEIKLMFKIYTYLTNLEGTEVEGKMNDTVITAENAIQDMNVTVIKKDETHENNKDNNKDNDAYVTDVSFALVVEPTGDDEESLKVTLVTSDGQTIVGRICGDKESDDEVMLEKEGENYWFRNIVLTEGGQTFTLNLEGVQNLDQGVYLYSSEVREGNSSQTLVGKAGGVRDFDVTIDLKFELDVQDNVVVKEHIWRDEYTPVEEPNDPPEEEEDPPVIYRLDPETEEEIPEEPVPLAAPVVTGDNSYLWILVVMMAVCGIVVINVSGKKNYAA